ncbi:hypothetical protein [Streptomyces sp. NPDC047043]|uniref:hypothetical protein n=1 Tax=Streptomyces sp. NPDC047043 TaxID=3154497 RepID=UPI0033DBE44E
MINPSGIPQFTGDFDQLDKDVSGLRSDAIGIRNGGMDVHSRFQMLGAYYTAPEAEDLFATTQPVMDNADTFATKLETVADALDTFSIEARPLAKRLEQLKTDALAFVGSVDGDDDWTEDEDKVHRNKELVDDVTATQLAFQDAERRAASKISTIVGGPTFVADHGSGFYDRNTVRYGYDGDLLEGAKELPWGSVDEQSYEAWSLGWFGHGAKSFVWDGIYHDGIEAGVSGLWTLVGGNGGDAAGDAWSGLKDVVTGIGLYTATPYDAAMDWAFGPDKESADEIRAKKAAKEFGKSLVAWDQWQENPTRAAGTTAFNFLTLAAGPLAVVSKTSEVGAVAKGASVAAKVGEFLDPLSVGLKATGKTVSALPKLSDLTSQIFKGAGASADAGRVHSVMELQDGSKVVIENGEFIAYDKYGNVISEGPKAERSAAGEAPEDVAGQERELAGVGSRTESPQASTHEGGGSSGAAADTGGSIQGHTSHASSPRQATDNASGSGGSHEPSRGAGRPSGRDHDSGGTNSSEDRELTAEERKRIRDEHVWKANNDPAWREEHYDALDRRRNASKVVDGAELPILAKDANGKLVSKYDLPSGPSDIKYGRTPLGPDTAHPVHRPELDRLAKNRKIAGDLTDASKAVEETRTHEAHEALKRAQEAYARQLGDVPNNSKISEKLGEKAAELHVVPHEFPGAEWVPLPKTPNGADMFDQVYKVGDDGGYLIVEAKAPSADLGWRRGAGPYEGMMVKQGTKEYFYTILEKMWARGGKDAEIANALEDALENEKLQYVLVKANENTGSYAGAVMEYFKIR